MVVNPSGTKTVNCSATCMETFSVELQKPATHTLKVEWRIQGPWGDWEWKLSEWLGLTIELNIFGKNEGTIAVTSRDETTMVLDDPNNWLVDTITWTVTWNGDQAVIKQS